ncbi:MAG: hypothetical protein COV02_02460 [Candidatus Terrybacteria bacterium CG10_big_fil_rev_8_21_14_0_10_41_10]|uniref:FAD/NAD(P)-binding domain-containing protein n=1 Tax=Candidatus Terrybacteria bacterium CG10_big_fil_rev_8_21_14_0_10_41_10 TaxID=1975026 RepID=A0A2M8LA30_9BACT|nr:MAG: hypothetical protein COV02_02460 [Candidatus Terrybacteria bacterium CG10_big_fil_rev_8_21_14_0_10_41_10]
MYDLIIIGGATSGLTAGIYAARKKLNAVILTDKMGGQALLTETIENYPGFTLITGFEFINKIKEQVLKHGLEIKEGIKVTEIKKDGDNFSVKAENGDTFSARSLIVATGKNPRRLGIVGEKEFENRGVSFCSTCDAPLYGGKAVAVIGGGNAGLGAAYDLLPYASNIYVLEFADKLLGDEIMQEKLKESGKVEFILNAQTKEIKGSSFVEKIIYTDRVSGQDRELDAQGVFVNIGQSPNSGFVKDFLEINKFGEIIIDPKTNETSVKGVFAAGDITDTGHKQYIVAAGQGANALLNAYEYLKNKTRGL